ncbi:MAG: PAS domain S-box protein [Methanoculleus sp.]|jgi:PAS domain S-box-containing protein
MRSFTPALDDLLEELEALNRHLRSPEVEGGAAPASGLLLERPLAGINDRIDALTDGIRSINADLRRYRDRFLHLPAGCLCTRPDGVIQEANPAAGTLFGLAPDRLQGTPLQAYLHPGCIPAFRSVAATLARGDTVPVQALSIVRPDGSTVPVAVAASIMHDSGDGAPGCLWVIITASRWKEVEEALRESEERYHELTENISDAFLALDHDARVVSWNRAAALLSGRSAEEVLGESIYVLFPEFRDERVTEFFREVVETGKPGVSECRLSLRRMKYTFEVRALPTRGGVSIYLRDISDRRRAEEALRKSEEECRAVVESQTEMIYRWLPDGTITFANGAYCRSIGIPCEDLLGRRHAPTISPDDLARIRQSQASITPDHPAVTVEYRVVMPDGRVRWQQWTDTAVFDEAGSIVEYQSVGRDTTNLRMAAEALLLANRKLNLLSDVTRHDILNLLNVLTGYLGLSHDLTDNPELLEYYRKEEEAVRGIQRYMAFTREYQDIGAASPKWQAVSRVVREAMAGLDTGEVTIEVQTDDLEVYADPLIVRVFTNLLDNSLRHGGDVTRIRIFSEESDRGISIIYEDDGIGIPHTEKEKVFKRGFGRQTGFGLFLAREILAITDLSVRETGEPGKGARFEISVPPGLYQFNGRDQVP